MVSALYHGQPWQADERRLARLSIPPPLWEELFARLPAQFGRTRELAGAIFNG